MLLLWIFLSWHSRTSCLRINEPAIIPTFIRKAIPHMFLRFLHRGGSSILQWLPWPMQGSSPAVSPSGFPAPSGEQAQRISCANTNLGHGGDAEAAPKTRRLGPSPAAAPWRSRYCRAAVAISPRRGRATAAGTMPNVPISGPTRPGVPPDRVWAALAPAGSS